MRKLLALSLAIFFAAAACAQQVGQNRDPNAPKDYTLSMKVQLVVETVVVKDKQGNPVHGLTAADFAVTEDGAPQIIRFCEHQDLVANAKPLDPSKPADENLKIYKRLAKSQIAPDTANNERYRNRRLLVLYFDMSAMRPADQLRALHAGEQFIRTQMTSVDLLSIMRYNSASVDVLQDFTADRDRLLSILQTMIVGEGQDSADEIDDASTSDTGAAFGQDDAEFNVFNTDRQLSALQTAAQMLGRVPEKKSLIYFAGGLRLNGINNQAQLHATVDAAIKAGVSFWPIDARGLVAEAPLGDATQGSQGNANIYTGAAANATTINFQFSQDTLYALAGDTGGKALLDANDLDRGIVQAQQAIADYYVIGYYTTNVERDGKFRRVKISLAQNEEAKLDYRQGYYADKEFKRFTTVDKERQLEDALMLEDPITELSIAMEIDYFQLNRAEYFVPLVVKIPGRELALAKRGGAEHTLIDFVGEVKDIVGGMTVTNVRDNVNIKLSDATAAELAHRPIEYDTGFTLLPGRYMIKFLARDDETGRIGTYQIDICHPQPEPGREANPDQLGGTKQSARRTEAGDLRCRKSEGTSQGGCGQSVGPGWQQADSQRNPGLQFRTECVCLSAGIQAACVRGFHELPAIARIRHAVFVRNGGIQDDPDCRAAQLHHPPRRDAPQLRYRHPSTSSRPIRLPGDGARSGHLESGLLARSYCHRAVMVMGAMAILR